MGIDLHAKAASDSQKIHNNNLGTGGDSVEVTVADTDSNELTLYGRYTDVSMAIDPETGMMVTGSRVGISFHQSDLALWDGVSDMQRWTVSFTNGAGQTVEGEIVNVMPDRYFGDVVVIINVSSGH